MPTCIRTKPIMSATAEYVNICGSVVLVTEIYMPVPRMIRAANIDQRPIRPLRLIRFSFLMIFMNSFYAPCAVLGAGDYRRGRRYEQDYYFFKLSSIADFIASSTLASAACFATRTAFLMDTASERP